MIDFDALPTLRSPRREMLREAMRLRERVALAKPCKGRKNHCVNRERSREAKARAERGKIAVARHVAALRAYRDAVRAYWSGERDAHPVLPGHES